MRSSLTHRSGQEVMREETQRIDRQQAWVARARAGNPQRQKEEGRSKKKEDKGKRNKEEKQEKEGKEHDGGVKKGGGGPDKTTMTGTAPDSPLRRREAAGFGPRRFRVRLTRNFMSRAYVLDGPYPPVLGQLQVFRGDEFWHTARHPKGNSPWRFARLLLTDPPSSSERAAKKEKT